MELIQHELVPNPQFEQHLQIHDLHNTEHIELILPTVDEYPNITVSIELPNYTTQNSPVLLAPQYRRRARTRLHPGIVLEFVIGLDHEDGHGGLIVGIEHFGIGGIIGISRIEG